MECSICLTNMTKTTKRILPCGHSFHYECLKKNEKSNFNCSENQCQCNECHTHKCPYCRTEYQNMVLRKRSLTEKEKIVQKNIIQNIKTLLDKCDKTPMENHNADNKFKIIISLFEYVIKNKIVLLNSRYNFARFNKNLVIKCNIITEYVEKDVKKGIHYIEQKNIDKWDNIKEIIYTDFTC